MPLPELVAHLTITTLIVLAWASGLWMKWPERVYQKTKDIRSLWSWMASLKISETEKNCVWSIRVFCVVQIAAAILGVILKVIFYSRWHHGA